MPSTNHQPAVDACAVFSAEWMRYEDLSGQRHRFYEGYRGVMAGWCNGRPEFTIDAVAAAALAATLADHVGGDCPTVSFDGHTLTVGGHQVAPISGRYRIGWGLPWHHVDAAHCDRIAGAT
jgi:hypothetical protein